MGNDKASFIIQYPTDDFCIIGFILVLLTKNR